MSQDRLKHVRRVAPGLSSISRMWLGQSGAAERAESTKKVTEGVPLVKLIKRKLATDPELVMLSEPRSVAAEKIRRLKTILANAENGGPQVLVITSAGPEEGKSLVSANLALAFAADPHEGVLLVDGDLRRPTVEHWIQPQPTLGLSELLTEQTELEHTLIELENSPLRVLPAGGVPEDPIELLGSERARDLIRELRTRFRRVIIDTPPSVPFADADAIGAFSDGILVVARAGRTRKANYVQSVHSLSSAPVLGTVLNDLIYNLADHESYQGYEQTYYDYYRRERNDRGPRRKRKPGKP
jgi:capsular exopolysaccharide synthesis family protein